MVGLLKGIRSYGYEIKEEDDDANETLSSLYTFRNNRNNMSFSHSDYDEF